MIFIIIIFYAFVCSIDILLLWDNKFKKEIPAYIFLISISLIINILLAINVDIPDPMIYMRSFLEWLKSILGGIL